MVNKTPARRKGSSVGLKSARATNQLLDMPVAAIIDALPDAAFLYDTRGRIMRASPAAQRLFALDAWAGFIGLPIERRVALLKPIALDGCPLPVEAWHIT